MYIIIWWYYIVQFCNSNLEKCWRHCEVCSNLLCWSAEAIMSPVHLCQCCQSLGRKVRTLGGQDSDIKDTSLISMPLWREKKKNLVHTVHSCVKHPWLLRTTYLTPQKLWLTFISPAERPYCWVAFSLWAHSGSFKVKSQIKVSRISGKVSVQLLTGMDIHRCLLQVKSWLLPSLFAHCVC